MALSRLNMKQDTQIDFGGAQKIANYKQKQNSFFREATEIAKHRDCCNDMALVTLDTRSHSMLKKWKRKLVTSQHLERYWGWAAVSHMASF